MHTGVHILMSQNIADDLQRHAAAQQTQGAGIAETVKASGGERNPRGPTRPSQNMIDPIRTERSQRRGLTEEHMAQRVDGTPALQVANQGGLNFVGERQQQGSPPLGLGDPKLAFAPVKIIQSQPGHFRSAKPIRGRQEQDGKISEPLGGGLVELTQQVLECRPWNDSGCPLIAINPDRIEVQMQGRRKRPSPKLPPEKLPNRCDNLPETFRAVAAGHQTQELAHSFQRDHPNGGLASVEVDELKEQPQMSSVSLPGAFG